MTPHDSPRDDDGAVGPAADGPAPRKVPKTRYLLTSRVLEQGTLALAMVLLARVVGAERFGPIATIIFVNSLSVALSDYGMGLAILRHDTEEPLSTRALGLLRRVNGGIAGAGLLLGGVVWAVQSGDGQLGAVIASSGVIWAVSAESFVRKSAAIRRLHEKRVAVAEITSSVVFAVVIVVAALAPDQAVVLAGTAFVAKHLTETAMVRGWRPAFGPDGYRPQLGALYGSQAAGMLAWNVDFVVVGIFYAGSDFSNYFLAFRVAMLAPAQVQMVMRRISLVSFARANGAERQEVLDRYRLNLFGLGTVGAVLTMLASPFVPLLAGADFDAAVWIVVALAVSIPFRLVFGIELSLALSGGATRSLFGWEIIRLCLFIVVFTLVAQISLPALVATVALANVASAMTYSWLVGRAVEVRPARFLVPAAVVATPLAILASSLIPLS